MADLGGLQLCGRAKPITSREFVAPCVKGKAVCPGLPPGAPHTLSSARSVLQHHGLTMVQLAPPAEASSWQAEAASSRCADSTSGRGLRCAADDVFARLKGAHLANAASLSQNRFASRPQRQPPPQQRQPPPPAQRLSPTPQEALAPLAGAQQQQQQQPGRASPHGHLHGSLSPPPMPPPAPLPRPASHHHHHHHQQQQPSPPPQPQQQQEQQRARAPESPATSEAARGHNNSVDARGHNNSVESDEEGRMGSAQLRAVQRIKVLGEFFGSSRRILWFISAHCFVHLGGFFC